MLNLLLQSDLLQNDNNDISLFDINKHNKCAISSCAWIVTQKFDKYIKKIGLNPNDYTLQQFNTLNVDGNKFKTTLKTIDKPKLISDMLGDLYQLIKYNKPNINEFDIIIDATGNNRSYLPKIENDIIIPCIQYKTHGKCDNKLDNDKINENDETAYVYSLEDGYKWCFGIGNNMNHIGYGTYSNINQDKNLINQSSIKQDKDIICGCKSSVRATSPFHSLPFYKKINNINNINDTYVIGIGESIGICSPLTGEGIVHGMKSCEILMNNINDLDNDLDIQNNLDTYTKEILDEFYWMKLQRDVINKFISNEKLSLKNIKTLYKSFINTGTNININTIFSVFKNKCM